MRAGPLALAAALWLVGGAAAAFEASISVDVAADGRPVERRLLGANIQWVHGGDGLLEADGVRLAPDLLRRVESLGPTVLRYPGGAQGDDYRWRAGIGPPAARGRSGDADDRQQTVAFGTDELLDLAGRLGAEPLFTVNVTTGTPEEAADWVRHTRSTNPRVRWWEIGNEPYLIDEKRRRLALPPAVYAARADRTIAAMRAVDPDILIGLPLRSDRLGPVPATRFPGYDDTVLERVREPFDFVALHNAYVPFALSHDHGDRDLYLAAMAGAQVTEGDFAATRARLARHFPGRRFPIAVTEYNAFFTLGDDRTDPYIASLAGALAVADLLRLFAETEDVALAAFWSLSGNWHFGAMATDATLRPAYHVLAAFARLLHGRYLTTEVRSPAFEVPTTVGIVAAGTAAPWVTALATRDGDIVRLLCVNRHPEKAARVDFALEGLPAGSTIELRRGLLTGDDPFAGAPGRPAARWRDEPSRPAVLPLRAELPPHSLALYEFRLDGSSRPSR